MPRFAIYAYDHVYEGLHGMNYQGVIEADNESAASEIAREKAYDIIDSYYQITDYIDEEIAELAKDNPQLDEIELDRIRWEKYREDADYEVFQLNEKYCSKLSTEELDEKCYDIGYVEFCELYCRP